MRRLGTLALIVLLFAKAILISGCSSSSVNNSTPLAPVFTSIAPTFAQQDMAYAYNLTATDPAGGTVSFALTSGPVPDAAISGSTLTWTPIHGQSRIADNFTVTATTSEGGTATQTWTVTPLGTIQGTWINTNVLAAGTTEMSPVDLSSTGSISALVPTGSGATIIPGTGTASGTFTIPGVPAGKYWLQHGIGYDLITTSDPDLGYFIGGRTGAVSGGGDSYLAITANGFPPAVAQVCDSWWVPNLNNNDSNYSCPSNPTSVVGNTLTDTVTLGELMDPSKGDQGYFIASTLAQIPGAQSLLTTAYAFGPDGVTTPAATTTPFSGTVSAMAFQATTAAIHRTAFAALRTTSSPEWGTTSCTTDLLRLCGGATANLDVQPYLYGKLYGLLFSGPPVLQFSDWSGDSSDFDLGLIGFGNFDPTEPLVHSAGDSPSAWSTVAGGDLYQFGGVYVDSASAFSLSSPARPLIGPANSPAINGITFFANQTLTSTTPTITWTAPSVGALELSYYQLLVYELTLSPDLCSPYGCFIWEPTQVPAYFTTEGTQVTIPAEILSPGGNYQFTLFVYNSPGSDLLTEQFPPTLNLSSAASSSGLISVSSSAVSKGASSAGRHKHGPLPPRILREQSRIRQQMQQSLREAVQRQQLMHAQ